MEVPTDVSFFSQFVEQNADIPVLRARGVSGYGYLQFFLPEQSSHLSTSRPSTLQFQVVGFGQWRSSRFSLETKFAAHC